MGGSKSYPVYSNVGVSISIDENYVVKSITTNDNYMMPIMGGLNCSGTSSEFFTYSQTEIDVPEKKDFEPYFGTSGEVSEEEKTGFDYLQDAFPNLQNLSESAKSIALKRFLNLPPSNRDTFTSSGTLPTYFQ